MARNEEKQLARLNRFYLQQQKEEELKKRPPRPKLEALTSVEDVKKWLPTILRDIDFYVKQMEVPCYPKRQIEEFERRIDHHRGEYKAFIRKLRQLEPDLKATPWSDRQYERKRKRAEADQAFREHEKATTTLEGQSGTISTTQSDSVNLKNFIPLSTPVLKNDSSYQHCYGFEKPTVPHTYEAEIQMQNEPLQFNFENRSTDYIHRNSSTDSKPHSTEHIEGHLEFNVACNRKSSNYFHTDGSQRKAHLMNKVSVVNNKTSRQSHPYVLNSDQVECSSIHFRAGIKNDENSNRDCKLGVIQSTRPKANPVSSSSDKISGISLLGALNIPYTDSSSSDGET